MKSALITVEGNIGSGKTHFCKEFSKFYNFDFYAEPVGDNPYLNLYYENPKRYALETQLWLLAKRFMMHKKAIDINRNCIFDRSIYGDVIFEKVNYDSGNISGIGHSHYMMHRDYMLDYLKTPDYVIFLDAKPEVCHYRILEIRKRECEKNISLDYLKKLYDYHFELLDELSKRGSKIIKLDWNEFKRVEDLNLFD